MFPSFAFLRPQNTLQNSNIPFLVNEKSTPPIFLQLLRYSLFDLHMYSTDDAMRFFALIIPSCYTYIFPLFHLAACMLETSQFTPIPLILGC